MANLAFDAVFVSSSNAEFQFDNLRAVCGPVEEEMRSISAALERYGTMGFQASSFARAVDMCRKMLRPQPPSPQQPSAEYGEISLKPLVQPTIFLGVAANLFGTGCREAIRFLCAECVTLPDCVVPAAMPDEDEQGVSEDDAILRFSFSPKALIHLLVVSGGAMEHDIRRACEPYVLGKYMSEAVREKQDGESVATTTGAAFRFGNVIYGGGTDVLAPKLFKAVMRRLVARLVKTQQRVKAAHAARQSPVKCGDICSWAFSPSTVWYLAGRWLPELFVGALTEVDDVKAEKEVLSDAQRRAESTVLYWAAKNDVPIFSPSFVDGDIMQFFFEEGEMSALPHFKVDLVMDIHRINRYAMRSRRTGMIILGGGVVKHHVCNANLMRNGADYTVFINNGQEFDGSDAGARPDEAVSWGKIRLDGEHVKLYAEVSLVFPLLVAQVFLPWLRKTRGLDHSEKSGVVSACV